MTIRTTGGLLLLAAGLVSSPAALAQQYVCAETNVGGFCMELYAESAPRTVANFLDYVNDGDYDSTFVHRSEPNYVIQGGGWKYDPLIQEVPQDAPVANEFSLPNNRGSVAMAKLDGNPDSATSEWFVNLANNGAILDLRDGGYTVFARIVRGMDVVDTIGFLLRGDLSNALQSQAFRAMPILRSAGSDGLALEDFVQVRRMYATDTLPPDALASFSGGSLVVPVKVGNGTYLATMRLTGTSLPLTFEVERSELVAIVANDREKAVYDPAARTLVIPSVRVGNRLLTEVTLDLVDLANLVFELDSYVEE